MKMHAFTFGLTGSNFVKIFTFCGTNFVAPKITKWQLFYGIILYNMTITNERKSAAPFNQQRLDTMLIQKVRCHCVHK